MNQGNISNNTNNNQNPMNGVTDNNGAVPTTAVQSINEVKSVDTMNSQIAKKEETVTDSNKDGNTINSDDNDVTKILSSSFGSKEKVNLLTPEQKAELIKKREAAMREKENYQPQPVGKFQKFFMSFLVIGLIIVVVFLPDINTLIVNYRGGSGGNSDIGDIATGTLKCVKETTDDNYNNAYTFDFDFTDNKLKKLTYYEVIKGSYVSDSADLENRLSSCNLLKSMISSSNGLRVKCSLSGGTLSKEQVFDYTILNVDQAITAYTEAGGNYPGEFALDADINEVEKNMNISDFSCTKFK